MIVRLKFWAIAAAFGLLPLLGLGYLARPAAASGIWYVAPGGNDSADCQTTLTPCASINAAIGKAAAGDTVEVASGTYSVGAPIAVVVISKNVTLLGGWDNNFATQTGQSTVDGEQIHRGLQVTTGTKTTVADFVFQHGTITSTNQGAGVLNQGNLTLSATLVLSNGNALVVLGGGIYNSGALDLRNSQVIGNVSGNVGAGIANQGALTITKSVLRANTAAGDGGGLYNSADSGPTTLTDVSVADNRSLSLGGGVFNGASMTINNSSITDNRSSVGGGLGNDGTLTLNNSTVSANVTSYGGGGAGGALWNNATANLNNATVTANVALMVGGILGGNINLKNSILAGNISYASNPDCQGQIHSLGYNLIGDATGCTLSAATGDMTNIDARLGVLVGWPGYHPLLPGSPAINAGNLGGCVGSLGPLTTDERGASRVGRCDIGAYEFTTPGSASAIVAYVGSNQSAPPSALFMRPFQALVLDSAGSPVPNAAIHFIAPLTGPSGAFTATGTINLTATTNVSGLATSSAFRANGLRGGYVISASVDAVNPSALFAVKNAAWYVTPGGDDNASCQLPGESCASIAGAVHKAAAGDTIDIAVGTYSGATGTEVVLLDKDMTLSGGWNSGFTSQIGRSTVDAEIVFRGLTVNSGVSAHVEKIVFQGGRSGAIDNAGTLTLDDVIATENAGTGAVSNSGLLFARASLFDGNTYAGVANSYVLRLSSSTISHNLGGGLHNIGLAWLDNSTVSGNTTDGDGGGIQNTGTLYLDNVTIFDNNAHSAGGIQNVNLARLVARNSIIAGNYLVWWSDQSDLNCSGTITSGGYNLIGDLTGCNFAAGAGDHTNIAAELGPLEDIDGPTPTHALLLGSPAINAGNPAGCLDNTGAPLQVDQRGFPRLGRCDIGAFEVQPLEWSDKWVSQAVSTPGQTLRYILTLVNMGAGGLSNVVVSDTLPAGLQFATGSLVATGGNAQFNNGVITWTGSLSGEATVSIRYSTSTLLYAPFGTVLTNTAAISAQGIVFHRQAVTTLGPAQLFIPVMSQPPAGIQGYVTLAGDPAPNVSLELRFYDGQQFSTRLATQTDANGFYNFTNAPSLAPGQIYYVRFLNTGQVQGRLSYWATAEITSYSQGNSLGAGDFDLADIALQAPAPGVTVGLPSQFQWSRRAATPTDSYQFSIFDPNGSAFGQTGLLGYVSGVTITGLPADFHAGAAYGWYVAVNSPDGGYGESYFYRPIIFSNTHAPSLPAESGGADLAPGNPRADAPKR